MVQTKDSTALSAEENYSLLLTQMKGLLEGAPHPVSALSNAAALLNSQLEDINWVGFYIMHKGELVLGPFQGKPACTRIPVGKGVCGTAVINDETQVVEDVHRFPGHIACDCESNSELVIPLRNQGVVVGVLDIDSPSLGRFDNEDAVWLEKIARVIEEACDWEMLKE